MTAFAKSRRLLLATPGLLLPGLLLSGAGRVFAADTPAPGQDQGRGAGPGQDKEVGAAEDLMREHGVLRRILLVYRETAARLRGGATVDPAPIRQAAELFRSFGEDYHEKKLEEAYIFPQLRQAGGPTNGLLEVLIAQHDRGREITGYILAVAGKGAIGSGDAEPLARAFETMDLMYENHTAREDTIVFPAWKDALSAKQLDEMGDKFEDIERQTFGHDGFDDAVDQVEAIEQGLGFVNLAQFTAPPPPKT
ncbi:MAG: hemerythrin domain-containing protein [Alphaproteobacteria bacterium]|nr:hemerythrin domain-containing protein [Alphaproteobacteria bacterium]